MKYSYISIITTDNYWEGVLVLYYSLMKTHPKYPLLLLVTANISQQILDKLNQHNINYKTVNCIENYTDFSNDQKLSRWRYTYSKLEIFAQVEFDKIVYLDADMVVLQNIDELFEKAHMSAANPSGRLPEFSTHHKQLNSGLMVIEPSLELYNNMMNIIKENPTSQYAGDQDIIHSYFPDWPLKKELHLDVKYHMFHSDLKEYNKLFGYEISHNKNSVKVIHYIGTVKPWHIKEKLYKLEFKMCLQAVIQLITKRKFDSTLYNKSLIIWLDYYRNIPNQDNRKVRLAWVDFGRLIHKFIL